MISCKNCGFFGEEVSHKQTKICPECGEQDLIEVPEYQISDTEPAPPCTDKE